MTDTNFKRIQPIEPQRDACGWWTHPDFPEPADGNEYFVPGELEAWLEYQGVEWSDRLMDTEVEPGSPEALAWENLDCNCAAWSPQPPEGEGWFLVSIHDTEDGPCAVWLRYKDGDA